MKTCEAMQEEVSPRCAWDAGCLLGEGPVWDTRSQTLWFVDIKGDALLAFDERRGGRTHAFTGNPSVIVPIEGDADMLCISRQGVERLTPATGQRRLIAPIEPHLPGNRPNDGKCDRSGRLWFGTTDDAETIYSGTLYRLDRGVRPVPVLPGIGVSNGLDWSPDGAWFYYTDSMRRTIWRYAYDTATGELGERRIFATLAELDGAPDGLTVDADGFVWSAHWDGWRVTRYDPDGRVDRVIDLPVPRPTSLCFGGGDLSTLYVTSARIGLSDSLLERAPLSGALLALQTGVLGLPSRPARLA